MPQRASMSHAARGTPSGRSPQRRSARSSKGRLDVPALAADPALLAVPQVWLAKVMPVMWRSASSLPATRAACVQIWSEHTPGTGPDLTLGSSTACSSRLAADRIGHGQRRRAVHAQGHRGDLQEHLRPLPPAQINIPKTHGLAAHRGARGGSSPTTARTVTSSSTCRSMASAPSTTRSAVSGIRESDARLPGAEALDRPNLTVGVHSVISTSTSITSLSCTSS